MRFKIYSECPHNWDIQSDCKFLLFFCSLINNISDVKCLFKYFSISRIFTIVQSNSWSWRNLWSVVTDWAVILLCDFYVLLSFKFSIRLSYIACVAIITCEIWYIFLQSEAHLCTLINLLILLRLYKANLIFKFFVMFLNFSDMFWTSNRLES